MSRTKSRDGKKVKYGSGPHDKRKHKEKLKDRYIERHLEDIPEEKKDKFFFGKAYMKSKLGKRFESEWKEGGEELIRMQDLKGVSEKKVKKFKGGLMVKPKAAKRGY